jgi:hypothetical protein
MILALFGSVFFLAVKKIEPTTQKVEVVLSNAK